MTVGKKKKDSVSSENALNESVEAKKHASTQNADYKYIIQNQKVRRHVKHRKIVSVVGIVLLVSLAGVGLFYGAYQAVEINSFKVFVDSSGSKVLSLSANSTFAYGTEQLEIGGPDVMDNTTLASKKNLINATPIQDRLAEILEQDSFQCSKSDKFIAATFYLRNVTAATQLYNEVLNLRNSTLNIETAVRVMLIRKRENNPNFEVMVYAKYDLDADGNPIPEKVVPLEKSNYGKLEMTAVSVDGAEDKVVITQTGEEAWYAEDFFSSEYIFYNQAFELAPHETIKYGIIIWLEGWDKDCVDDKLAGTIRMDFAFEQKK